MGNENRKVLLDMSQIVKEYVMGEETVRVLKGIDLKIYDGEFVAILGPSGSGKSTLMNIIGCLDVCTSGSVVLNGTHVDELSEKELSKIRNKEIGFVFQQFQLLQKLNALKNVELPLIYAGVPEKERRERAKQMLEKVGLGDKTLNRPNQLSGGQQQRVAVARALVTNPSILLADEPTGALDQKTGIQIMELFKSLHAEGKTIIMITHDEKIAQNAGRIVRITDGELFEATEVEVRTLDNNIDDDDLERELLLSNSVESLPVDNALSITIEQDVTSVIVNENTNQKINELMEALDLDDKSVVVLTHDKETGENVSRLIKLMSKESVGDDKC